MSNISEKEMAKKIVVICPFCGESQPAGDSCRACGGFFDELSRQATHNDMGPWFIRSPQRPYQPGCSYETIIKLIERQIITKFTIIRGPTSKQFWTIAKRVPGIAHLLGYCHSCDEHVNTDDHGCSVCGVPFGAYLERNILGLPSIKPMPWEAKLDESAVGVQHQGAQEAETSSSTPARGGISSFARDSEISNGADQYLQSSTASYADAAGYETPHQESEAHEVQPAPITAPLAGIEHPGRDSSQATRVLRRELSKQRRLSTILIALLIIAVVVMLMTNLDRLTARPGPESEQQTEGDSAATIEKAPAESTPRPPSEELDSAARLSRAEYLLAQAGDSKRIFDDRINDYEEALEILRKLQENGMGTEAVVTLIEQAEASKEKLELDELLP